MNKLIQEVYKTNALIELYTDREVEKFTVCRIMCFDDAFVLLSCLKSDGSSDGLLLVKQNEVFMITQNSKYLIGIQKICISDNINLQFQTIQSDNCLITLLEIALKEQKILKISVCDSGYYDVIGLLIRYDDEFCVIKEIDQYGYEDGETKLKLSAISKIMYADDFVRLQLFHLQVGN